MMISMDYQPPSVPQISEDTKDAIPQSRQPEEISANDISGIGELCAIDFYNLRNVDDVTKSRKKEQQRMRKERIQNKHLRKQRKIREAKEIVDNVLKIREELHKEALKFDAWMEEQKKQRKQDGNKNIDYYCDGKEGGVTTEVINEPPNYTGGWEPYESDHEFGTAFELKHTSWGIEEFTLELARCTVGLESFTGDKELSSCSGTIIEFLMGIGYVVTSASLIRCPDKDEQADELKINVWLPSGEKLEGSVSNVDFHYNICVVEVPSTFQLPSKSFSADTRFFNLFECHSKDVVALGRICKPWGLRVASGKLIPRRSQFDCEELLVSSCKTTKRGVGGPLMDFDGNIIGMNFYDKKDTPFLPSFIVLKCLQHFKDFEKVIRPLHGLRVRSLHEAELAVLEKIQLEYPEVCGVIVEKVGEPAEHSGIAVGDVITHVDGVPFSNAAELGGILLDTCGQHVLEREKLNLSEDCNQMGTVISLEFSVKTRCGKSGTTTATRKINIDKFSSSGLNRWPLPRRIIVRRYAGGVLMSEEWYGLRSPYV